MSRDSDCESYHAWTFPQLHPGKVLLVGEAMALFTAQEEGDLARVNEFGASVAGAELNVAVGLARLGQHPTYLTKLAADPFGGRIREFLERNGIDTSLVIEDNAHPTGFMMKSKVSEGDPKTAYFRKGSSASTICTTDIEQLDWSGISLLHLTGILPPLSETTSQLAHALVEQAHKRGITISFDPNLRPSLWKSAETMRQTLRELSAQADIVLPGIGEGKELFGVEQVDDIAQAFIDNGAKLAIVKDGPKGAYVSDGIHHARVAGFVVDHVVDTVGAGDGFAAGVLSALLEGQDVLTAAERGCALGAIQTQFVSDNEGLPTPDQLHTFIATHKRVSL